MERLKGIRKELKISYDFVEIASFVLKLLKFGANWHLLAQKKYELIENERYEQMSTKTGSFFQNILCDSAYLAWNDKNRAKNA